MDEATEKAWLAEHETIAGHRGEQLNQRKQELLDARETIAGLRADLAQARMHHSWQQSEIARLTDKLAMVSHFYNEVRAPARAQTPPGFPSRALQSPRQSVGLITERG